MVEKWKWRDWSLAPKFSRGRAAVMGGVENGFLNHIVLFAAFDL